MYRIIFIIGAIFLFFSCSRKAVTLESLLLEMTDREAIARFPDPAYTLKQFSSYDRATVQPGSDSWFANWDRSMFIRTDTLDGRKEYVLFDADGPGAVVRFWMTFAGENSGKGIMRIYFDNQTNPEMEGTAFDILSGTALTGAPLASSVSDSTKYERRGHNLYLPLPYARHCKITYESKNIRDAGAKTGGEAAYYNIGYRTYEKNTRVTTFSMKILMEKQSMIQITQKKLAATDPELNKNGAGSTSIKGEILPGKTVSASLQGSEAIRMLVLKVASDVDPQTLRTTVIEMIFDGERTVWCPLGDFFGTGYMLRKSNTWYSSVKTDGLLCSYWVMPYRENAEVKIHNLGEKSFILEDGLIITAPWKWDNRSMHFGTSWHQYTHLQTGESKNNEGKGGPFDINYVTLNGKGVYAGDALATFNTAYAWWGEGDEKIFVDGESFPSHVGTGTEDYYGYAWCRPEIFTNHPFISQPSGSGNFWPGYTLNMRFRDLDAIPFTSSLKFDMEMWHWAGTFINHAPVTFWYVLPGGTSTIQPDIDGARAKVALKRSDIISPLIVNDTIEGENMELCSLSGGKISYQRDTRFGWSANQQIFWTNGNPGDELELSFISPDEKTGKMIANFTIAPDYGTVSVSFNGKLIPGQVNLNHSTVETRMVDLGKFHIRKGANMLKIKIVKSRPTNNKAFFGLDLIKVN
jgi:hypothetical protein